MPTEFSLFSALPTELREEIWNLAIRPKRSGVHIFRVYSIYMDHETSPEEVIHFSANEASFYRHERCELSLAVPLPHKSLDGANKDGARITSSYMIDTGLWTACHESRLMMQKHFLQDPWLSPSWTGYYISGGAPAYITIRYNDDLVILQLDSLELEKWDDETVGRLQNIHDIDIEYRAEWSIDFYEEDEGGDEADVF